LATARSPAFRSGHSFIHPQRATAEFPPVQLVHSLCRFLIVCHFDESKSTRLAGFPIIHDTNACELAIGFEERPQVSFCGLKTHVSNEQILHF
jgi:hypothetical protein